VIEQTNETRTKRGAKMKKKRILLLVFCFLLIFPALARAEWCFDIYGGQSTTRDANVDAEVSSFDIFGSSSQSHTEKVGFDPSFTMGTRLGYWFDKLPWLGVSLDLSYFKAEGEKAESDVIPLSLLLMLRLPLFKSEKFPNGRIQPYGAIGPGLFFSHSRADFRPNLPEKISGDDAGIGLDLRAGLSWQFHRHWAIFGEYRYTDVKIDFTQEDSLAIFSLSGTDESMKTHLKTNHFLAGISYRF
jgi:opacity protein-like surface antigen